MQTKEGFKEGKSLRQEDCYTMTLTSEHECGIEGKLRRFIYLLQLLEFPACMGKIREKGRADGLHRTGRLVCIFS